MRRLLALSILLASATTALAGSEPSESDVISGVLAVRFFVHDYYYMDPNSTFSIAVQAHSWRSYDTGEVFIRYSANWVQMPNTALNPGSIPTLCTYNFLYQARGGWVTELSGRCLPKPQETE